MNAAHSLDPTGPQHDKCCVIAWTPSRGTGNPPQSGSRLDRYLACYSKQRLRPNVPDGIHEQMRIVELIPRLRRRHLQLEIVRIERRQFGRCLGDGEQTIDLRRSTDALPEVVV